MSDDLFKRFEKISNTPKYKIGREICANLMRFHAKFGTNLEINSSKFNLSEDELNDILAGAGKQPLYKYEEILNYVKNQLKNDKKTN